MANIFREKALERLSSPDRLDTLITVTSPRAWLALIGIAVVIAGAVVWGFAGRTQETLGGSGIMLRKGGLYDVTAPAAGVIAELMVKAGDQFDRGTVIARLGQPEIDEAIAESEARMEDLQRDPRGRSAEIDAERRQMATLTSQHERTSRVRATLRGRVIEILADVGTHVQAGESLLAAEMPDEPLDCYVFVPLNGKVIQPGMAVRVMPAGVSWEEYGYIVGRVRSVSEAPLSPAAMNTYLHNPTLVQQFNAEGGAYLVDVDLVEDTSTSSGFKWTTHTGPSLHFGSGTLVTANVIVREQAPITFVVPALRRWFGL